jgi:class 3 adenylate cyclase
LSGYHEAIGRLVLAHEATLERFTGDGMMVVLGDPLPLERPATRALELAVEMRAAATELTRNWKKRGLDLGLAMGVAKGFATVGAIGFEGRIDYGAIGTVTNLASRLCQRAGADEILISQRVLHEVEAAAMVEDLGELELHGFARPTRAYRCLGLRGGGTA